MLCANLGVRSNTFLWHIIEYFLTARILNPPKKELARNYLNSGVDCHKQPKRYRHTQKAGTVRHISQFDKHERRKNIIHFNAMSQRDILIKMSRTEGYDEVDYIYNS
jgi:hypothetical protein